MSKYVTKEELTNVINGLQIQLIDTIATGLRILGKNSYAYESEANLKQGTIDIVFGFHDPTTLKLDIDNEHFEYFLLGQDSFDDIVKAIETIVKKHELQKVTLLFKPGNKDAVHEVLSRCHAAKCIFEMQGTGKK